jgi:DNA-directed RNA polymerase subunit RPC12/RpoP
MPACQNFAAEYNEHYPLPPMTSRHTLHTTKPILTCPYCEGTRITKNGTRAKKHGKIQLYACAFCGRTFTPLATKHRTYPLRIIVETLSRYNRLQPLAEVGVLPASLRFYTVAYCTPNRSSRFDSR